MTRVSCNENDKFSSYSDFIRSRSSSSSGPFKCYYRRRHSDLTFEDSDESDLNSSVESRTTEFHSERRLKAYKEVMLSYDRQAQRIGSLPVAKSKILRYTPGAWMEKAGSNRVKSYSIPKTTMLVVIGPQGSGKSCLINRITKMLEGDRFAPDRAQVTYDPLSEEGTFFATEYMVPRGSSSFCLYDTRGFNRYNYDHVNHGRIKEWMNYGLIHKEPMIWESDSCDLSNRLTEKARGHNLKEYSKTRTVNFVIFVVNALEVLKSMRSEKIDLEIYNKMISDVFKSPYLSFKDDTPAVVITHGDLLSLPERTCVRVHLGELLNIRPDKQIFDIPGSFAASTELTVLDMLRYCLEHADKNLKTVSFKQWVLKKLVVMIILVVCLLAVILSSLRTGY